MGVSAGKIAALCAFLFIGMLLAGLIFQPKASVEGWEVKESDFQSFNTSQDKIEFLLNYAILAPSSYNSQPWKFNISGDEIKLFADKNRWLTVADADQRGLCLSAGCALENLLVAADHFGYRYDIHYFPDNNRSDLVAIVNFIPDIRPGDSRFVDSQSGDPRLFHAIQGKADRSNLGLNKNQTISNKDLQQLQDNSSENEIHLYLTSDPDTRKEFRDLTVQADRALFSNVDYKSELGYWLGQGVMGPTGIQAKIAQLSMLFLEDGSGQTRKDAEMVNSTPFLGFITSRDNDRVSQVKAGQLFEQVQLKAIAQDIRIYPMIQAAAVPETKMELEKLVPQKGLYIQQIFLLGYSSTEDERLPKRPLKDFLINPS